MRDFTWNYFIKTGDLDAYLLYKQMGAVEEEEEALDQDMIDEWEDE